MDQVSLKEAGANISDLVERAAAGEEIVIARNGVPRAKLVPVTEPAQRRRPAGALGVTHIAADFDAPDPEFDAMFGGRD